MNEELYFALGEALDSYICNLEIDLFALFFDSADKSIKRKSLNTEAFSLDDPQIKTLCGLNLEPTYENGMSFIERAQNEADPYFFQKAGYRILLNGALDTGCPLCFMGVAHCLKNGIGTTQNLRLAKQITKKYSDGFGKKAKRLFFSVKNFFSNILDHIGDFILLNPQISLAIFLAFIMGILVTFGVIFDFADFLPLLPLVAALICLVAFLFSSVVSAILKKKQWRCILSLSGFCIFCIFVSFGGYIDEKWSIFICGIGLVVSFIAITAALTTDKETLFKILTNPFFTSVSMILVSLSATPLLSTLPEVELETLLGSSNSDYILLFPSLGIYVGIGFMIANIVNYYSKNAVSCAVGAPLGCLMTLLSITEGNLFDRFSGLGHAILQMILLLLGVVSFLTFYYVIKDK